MKRVCHKISFSDKTHFWLYVKNFQILADKKHEAYIYRNRRFSMVFRLEWISFYISPKLRVAIRRPVRHLLLLHDNVQFLKFNSVDLAIFGLNKIPLQAIQCGEQWTYGGIILASRWFWWTFFLLYIISGLWAILFGVTLSYVSIVFSFLFHFTIADFKLFQKIKFDISVLVAYF